MLNTLSPALREAAPTLANCGVIELRSYTLKPGRRDALIELFEREFIEPQTRLGIRLPGLFRDPERADRFVWLRGFASMPARAAALQGFYDGPVWHAHRDEANATMVDSDDVLLLRHVMHVPPGLARSAAPRRWLLGVCPLPSAYSCVSGPLRAALSALLDRHRRTVHSMLETDPSPNNFARLPVRVGEKVIVFLSAFADDDAGRSESARWQEDVRDVLRQHGCDEAPAWTRLAPTRKSNIQ